VALLEEMPKVRIPSADLQRWGIAWLESGAFGKKQGMDFGSVFDIEVGRCLAEMLGGVDVVTPRATDLLPGGRDVVEVGPVRIVVGIRPQNYDVGYRPDGVRFVFDSKTLNDTKSVSKNFQNMVNDLGTEATTVHTRFPYALVAFMVVVPAPCFRGAVRTRFTRMLDRLVGRDSPIDVPHKAEALSLVLWDPSAGVIDADWPEQNSPLRIERFAEQVQAQYYERYDGMPPHDRASAAQRAAIEQAGEELPEPEDSEEQQGPDA
jgi:hypothetical protein